MKKEKKIRRPSRIMFCLMTLLLVIVLALNAVMINVVSPYYGFINNFLASAPDTEEAKAATAASAEITQEVEEEGIILLTNDGTLPLKEGSKINLFGASVVNFCFGGSGSGSGDTTNNVRLQDGLKNAGFEVNENLITYYQENVQTAEVAVSGFLGSDYNLYEISVSDYPEDLLSEAKAFSDTAVVLISRVGGEGYDLPMDMDGFAGGDAGKSYLELQDKELELIDYVRGEYENVVVVLNSPNAMELGFLELEGVDAALWIGCPGSTGNNAVGEALAGTVNPSGRTTDTFPYEVESAPSYYNFGDYDYPNITYVNNSLFGGTSIATTEEDPYHYVEYVEGIYVGYRYYETAAADGFIDYQKTVQFPFGYGLSYTTFAEEIADFQDDGTTITMSVKVTNTGSVAGKDVVEAYYTAPYTKGGIEKSEVVLADFEKTSLLEAGQSETVTLSWNYEDMASYDYTGIKAEGGAYVLEAGEYKISLRRNSHEVVEEKAVTVAKDVIYNDANDGPRSTDDVAAVNQFDDMSFDAGVVYVTRADWAGTMPTERAASSKEANAAILAAIEGEPLDNRETEDIVFKKNGLKLSDMKGLDYDDEQWELLLQQVSVNEMKDLVTNGGWSTHAVKSVKKPYISDCDGPNGINNMMAGIQGNQFASECVLGCTWNKELANRVGYTLGAEAAAFNVGGLYAPALNIHRSPFSGRNYEYISEDGVLTGKLIASEIQGMTKAGIYCYAKHFVLNDQETNRDAGGLCTWVSEQAAREIYMKGFEIAVKEGQTLGIMSSFNRVGAVPVAESYELLTTVLRDEWGFRGCVITDCVMAVDTEDFNRALRAGNDLELTILGQTRLTDDTLNTAAGRQALRKATHNILYMVANSNALETVPSSNYGWLTILRVVDVVLLALFALYYYRRHKKMKRWKEAKKQEEQMA